MRSIVIALLLTTGLVIPAAASIIQVPSAHATIQAGINAAAPGDTVQVAPGTYTGPSNRNLDFAGKNILLRSSAGAATTIIDCQNLARGIRFHTGETAGAIVQGFTIRNGLASGTFGGGILVESDARPTIRNCRFQTNHANTGGGVFVSSGVTLTDCDFEANAADNYGGGAYGETADLLATRCSFTQNTAGIGAGVSVQFGATATLTDCTFTENDPANLGGGFHSSASTVALLRCSFVRNTGKNGAGAYLINGTATVDTCTFTLNTADYGGGGMCTKQVFPLSVTACTFEYNSIVACGGYPFDHGGGGFLLMESHPPTETQVVNCLFVGNQALTPATPCGGADGGGLYAGSNTALVKGCTFINNHSNTTAGGAHCRRLHDCVFEGNTSDGNSGGVTGPYEVINCRFTNNHAQTVAGGCWPGSGPGMPPNIGPCTVINCEFSGNSASFRGGGLYWVNQLAAFTMDDCLFQDNYASEGGGAYMYCGGVSSVTGCTFVGNTAQTGGALNFRGETPPPSVTLAGSTLVANGAPIGGGIRLEMPVQIANTIIAFGTGGEAVACLASGVGALSCMDIFGNAGGNWTGCISDQVGINGNFSLDPLFCNRAGRDFTLAQASPCSPAHSPAQCGLIGAQPVGCATPIGVADAGAPAVTPILRVTPNPMRGAGVIEWAGVGGRETELRLYDVAGRIVARRVESGAGGELQWSALVGAGGVPSGVYFLEIGARREVAERVRLVVIR